MAKRFDNPKYDAAFDRCIDVMAQMLIKYGPQILEQRNMSSAGAYDVTEKKDPSSENTTSQRKAKKTA